MSQTNMILSYMRRYGSITTLDAFVDLGCTRLPARIKDLTKAGYPIGKKQETSLNRFGKKVTYARYYLKGDEQQ